MEKQPEKLEPQTKYYALEQLTLLSKTIETLSELFPIYRQRMGEFMDTDRARAKEIFLLLQGEKTKMLDTLENCRLFLLELGDENLAKVTGSLKKQLADYNLLTPDYTQLATILTSFVNHLPTAQTVNARTIGRLMNNVRMGHYPTDLAHIEMLTQGIEFPKGVVTNIFDPCCGTGIALRTMATGNNCMTYGSEIDEQRASEAQDRLHRVAFGSFFHARISRESFHVMLLNPPYLSVINESGNRARHEKRFLADSYEHLMLGGVLIYILPYYRLTSDIARILCENFTDIRVFRFTGKEFERFSQIAVIGIRKKRMYIPKDVESFVEMVEDHEKLPLLSELLENQYVLPTIPKEVPIFKGDVFNVVELARQFSQSTSLAKRIQKNQLDNRNKRPLLPLNVGQVGLLGGCGMINGLAQCDNPHVIKGMIIKDTIISEQVTEKDRLGNVLETERTECVTNKLVFYILTNKGFKSLTQ